MPDKYVVVCGTEPATFASRVSLLLDDGYVLRGDLAMSVDEQSVRHFAQVLVWPGQQEDASPLGSDFK